MTPHLTTLSTDDKVNTARVGDEINAAGFHREVKWVECSCGKRFEYDTDGYGNEILEAAQNHVREAEE